MRRDRGAFPSHCFRNAGHLLFDDLQRGIRRYITGAYSRASGGKNEIKFLYVRVFSQRLFDQLFIIGNDLAMEYRDAHALQHGYDFRAALISPFTPVTPVAYGYYSGIDLHFTPLPSLIRR